MNKCLYIYFDYSVQMISHCFFSLHSIFPKPAEKSYTSITNEQKNTDSNRSTIEFSFFFTIKSKYWTNQHTNQSPKRKENQNRHIRQRVLNVSDSFYATKQNTARWCENEKLLNWILFLFVLSKSKTTHRAPKFRQKWERANIWNVPCCCFFLWVALGWRCC